MFFRFGSKGIRVKLVEIKDLKAAAVQPFGHQERRNRNLWILRFDPEVLV